MISRRERIRLEDILQAIDDAHVILDSADFAEYQRSVAKRKGVERCIEIISGASRHVSAELLARNPEIPWSELAGIGNLLRHHYRHVDDLVIWRAARKDLIELRTAIEAYLAE